MRLERGPGNDGHVERLDCGGSACRVDEQAQVVAGTWWVHRKELRTDPGDTDPPDRPDERSEREHQA